MLILPKFCKNCFLKKIPSTALGNWLKKAYSYIYKWASGTLRLSSQPSAISQRIILSRLLSSQYPSILSCILPSLQSKFFYSLLILPSFSQMFIYSLLKHTSSPTLPLRFYLIHLVSQFYLISLLLLPYFSRFIPVYSSFFLISPCLLIYFLIFPY